MWKKYGFYLPDAAYLKDPEGLLQYLVCAYPNIKVHWLHQFVFNWGIVLFNTVATLLASIGPL